ncbi:MAG: glycoside hydrolase family 43 protein [Nibricoccus sp.]
MKNTLVAFALALGFMAATVASAETPKTAYLFTYFTGNGADGLHLAWSKDGLKWEALGGGKSYLTPVIGKSKLMRDPCVALGPDGAYHMVWTSGWWENGIGHASTKDFITWSEQQDIPVMAHEPAVRNTWAPELIWDKKREQFLIFWASTIPGKFAETAGASEDDLNHRMYATTTKDWKAFTPTRLWYDPGFSVIDATIVPDGDGYQLVVKDETKNPVKKHLRHASAGDVEGPWSELSTPFTRDWVEGPTVLKVSDAWIVFFDVYKEKHYGALRTRDWKTFEDITAEISLPKGIRHGTAIEVPYAVIERLLQN